MKAPKLALLGCAAFALVSFSRAAFADDALFHDLGEKAGIEKIAASFTRDLLADPRVKAQFDNTNMDRFQKLFVEHICQITGGPCVYTGRTMAATHKGLHLHNADFNAVVEDLQKAMREASIPFATQNRLLSRLAPMQHDIVTR